MTAPVQVQPVAELQRCAMGHRGAAGNALLSGGSYSSSPSPSSPASGTSPRSAARRCGPAHHVGGAGSTPGFGHASPEASSVGTEYLDETSNLASGHPDEAAPLVCGGDPGAAEGCFRQAPRDSIDAYSDLEHMMERDTMPPGREVTMGHLDAALEMMHSRESIPARGVPGQPPCESRTQPETSWTAADAETAQGDESVRSLQKMIVNSLGHAFAASCNEDPARAPAPRDAFPREAAKASGELGAKRGAGTECDVSPLAVLKDRLTSQVGSHGDLDASPASRKTTPREYEQHGSPGKGTGADPVHDVANTPMLHYMMNLAWEQAKHAPHSSSDCGSSTVNPYAIRQVSPQGQGLISDASGISPRSPISSSVSPRMAGQAGSPTQRRSPFGSTTTSSVGGHRGQSPGTAATGGRVPKVRLPLTPARGPLTVPMSARGQADGFGSQWVCYPSRRKTWSVADFAPPPSVSERNGFGETGAHWHAERAEDFYDHETPGEFDAADEPEPSFGDQLLTSVRDTLSSSGWLRLGFSPGPDEGRAAAFSEGAPRGSGAW